MSIIAVVENGQIKLPIGILWKSGTIVRVDLLDEKPLNLFDSLKEFDGMATDLPADFAENLSRSKF